MTTCSKHPTSPLALFCPLCEGERLADLDRRAGKRFRNVRKSERTPSPVVQSLRDVVNQTPGIPATGKAWTSPL